MKTNEAWRVWDAETNQNEIAGREKSLDGFIHWKRAPVLSVNASLDTGQSRRLLKVKGRGIFRTKAQRKQFIKRKLSLGFRSAPLFRGGGVWVSVEVIWGWQVLFFFHNGRALCSIIAAAQLPLLLLIITMMTASFTWRITKTNSDFDNDLVLMIITMTLVVAWWRYWWE